jgi:hypothetical protein
MGEDVLELAASEDEQPVQALAPEAADPAPEVRVRVRRPHQPPRITLSPSPEKTVSKAWLNFASRSWIRNRSRCPRSARLINRLRACCSIQPPSGLLAQATYSIRRLPMQLKTSTYSRFRKTVSTARNRKRALLPRAGAGTTARPADHVAAAGHPCRQGRSARASPRHRSRGIKLRFLSSI